MDQNVQKTMEIPQDKLIRWSMSLLCWSLQVPVVRVVAKTVEIPKSLFVEKTVVIPGIQTVQGPQTAESLSPEITVAGKTDHEIVVKNVVPNIEIDSYIDDLSTVDSNGSSHPDCEGPSHVGKQSGSMQQQHQDSNQQQPTRQVTQEKRGESEKERKGEGGKEEEGTEAEEAEHEQVKKDVTVWAVVASRKERKRTVQIFVKVDGMNTVRRKVSPEDTVLKILKTVSGNDQDVYLTCEGRMLRTEDQLKCCGIGDKSTIQVLSRMRGGGKHKDKKSKVEKKQVARQEPLKSEGPAILETEDHRKLVEDVSGGSDIEVERKMQHWAAALQAGAGLDNGQMRVMECGLRWAVKQGEKEGEKSKNNGGRTRKSNGGTTSKSKVGSKRQGKGDVENKGRIQNRNKVRKCVSVKKID